jgi:NAD(P)-dependent dehydrogenase (short-subunit alcohol dehydrogenase family)
MPDLKGKIAVVTGASRGAGRGIALALGESGATVYVTGRSSRAGGPTTNGRPETFEETAELVTARGGIGIPVRCDHTVEADIEALFAQVEREQGRLDLLVNNAWGGYEGYDETFDKPFWEQPVARFDRMWTAGLRSHFVTSRHAVPLLLRQRNGLIVNITTIITANDFSSTLYATIKTAKQRMTQGMAHDLKPYGVAVVGVAPGFMRTEVILMHFKTTEADWQSVPDLARTETPQYVGRAVAALLADPNVLEKAGQTIPSGDLAKEYGFTDVDGRYVPSFYTETGKD